MPTLSPRGVVSALLTAMWNTIVVYRALSTEEKRVRIIQILRRFPYWADGHRALADYALQEDSVATAYGASLCALNLNKGNLKLERESLMLLGQCCLKRGDSKRALGYFLACQEHGLDTPALLENLAAAHILNRSFEEALHVLRKIDSSKISAEGKAALNYVSSKVLQ